MPPADQQPPPTAGDLTVYAARIEELRPDPANARRHPASNKAAIRASLAEFGQRRPLVLDADRRTVIAGSGTLEQARALGFQTVWVTVFPGTAEQARAYAIADNRAGELSDWDADLLRQTLAGTPPELLPATGFGLEDLAAAPDPAAAALAAVRGRPPGDLAVIVFCDNEMAQRRAFEDLTAEGFDCRVVST